MVFFIDSSYNNNMTSQQIPQKIPQSLHQFFWDIDVKKLNPAKHPYYVINRLLDKGNPEAVRWILAHFPRELIVETFKKIRDFSPWNGRFWANYLDLPTEEVACLQTSYLKQRRELWQF